MCNGCGHDSIASQIIAVAYDLSLAPHRLAKFSGIGCSSKSPAYFLGRSHSINGLHGRMPSLATGALTVNRDLIGLGVSGDGDTGSIGFGQFKHMLRRNVEMVYIIENNGVYGLTKGQFSATADIGQELKYAGKNELPPIDLCLEAIASGAGFVARSFAGDPKQVQQLLKAALELQRHGRAGHHQPVRHLQQLGPLDQGLQLGQGTRRGAARSALRHARRRDHGGVRAKAK